MIRDKRARTWRRTTTGLLMGGLVLGAAACSGNDSGRETFSELEQESFESGDPAGLPENPPHRTEEEDRRRAVRDVYASAVEGRLREMTESLEAIETGREGVDAVAVAEVREEIAALEEQLVALNQVPEGEWKEAQQRFDSRLGELERDVELLEREARLAGAYTAPEGRT